MNHRNWKFQSQNVQIFGYVYQNTNGPNHGPAWKTQSSFLSEVCTVILWQDCCGKGNSRKFFWNTVGKEFQIGNAYLWTEKKDYSCLCMWTKKKKLTGKKQNIDPMWKVLTKEVDLGEPTSFFDQVYLGCTQEENAKRAKILLSITEIWLNPGSLQEPKKSNLVQASLTQTSLHGPMMWKVMQRNVWSDVASWRTKQPSNCTMLQRHVLMTIKSKKKNWDLLENCQRYACTSSHQMDQSLWQTLGSFAFLYSSFNWMCAILSCGKHCTTVQTGTISGLWFCWRSWRLKIDFKWILCFFASHTFVPISCMWKKPTSVSHISTESEIISLDASLRMDGIHPLDLWDLVTEVLPSSSDQRKTSKENVQGNLLHGTPSRKNTLRTKLKLQSRTRSWIMHRRLCFLKREVFWSWCDALHFWR